MLYGAIFMLGSAHTLNIERHVRIESLYSRLSDRLKAVVDGVFYLVFYFPSMGILFFFGSKFAIQSWRIWERGGESMWQPPIYPFKTILPLSALLLLLQGGVQFFKCIMKICGKGDVDSKP